MAEVSMCVGGLYQAVLELFTELAFGPARLVVRGYQAPQKPPPPPRIIPAALEKKLPWPWRFATEIDWRWKLEKPRDDHVDSSSSSLHTFFRQRLKKPTASAPRAPPVSTTKGSMT